MNDIMENSNLGCNSLEDAILEYGSCFTLTNLNNRDTDSVYLEKRHTDQCSRRHILTNDGLIGLNVVNDDTTSIWDIPDDELILVIDQILHKSKSRKNGALIHTNKTISYSTFTFTECSIYIYGTLEFIKDESTY